MKIVDTKYSKELKTHVCKFCGNSNLKTVYVITGHDHTDDTVYACNCGNGEDIEEYVSKNRYVIDWKVN